MHYGDYRRCAADQYPYTVQPGDTLNGIALRLEVGVARIMAANPGIDPYRLQVGQVLCIPACPPNHTPKIIEAGDTLYRIAQAYGVSVPSILEANPSVDPNYLRVGQRICIPSACASGPVENRETIGAMADDIAVLKAQSSVQQTNETNYGASSQTTRAIRVTETELQFDAAPVSFQGRYKGRYTEGKSYP